MKTSKENDNRFTKDVLLRQIFQEISDENRENSHSTPVDDLIDTHEKTSSKRGRFLKWIFFIIFATGIVYVWFYTVTEVTQTKEVPTKSESYSAPATEQTVQPKEKPTKTLSLDETDTIQFAVETPPQIEDPKTEREKAKEALFLQMQN